MKYLLDLDDGLEPITCRNSERALQLVRIWNMVRSPVIQDQMSALRELRESFIEVEELRQLLIKRMVG